MSFEARKNRHRPVARAVLSVGDGRQADGARGEGLTGLRLTFLKSGWCLSLLCAGVLQSEAAVGLLSLTPPSGSASGLNVKLGWKPSPSTNASGYLLNWGYATGQSTNQLDVGNVTNTTVNGLTSSTTYYFNIVGYDVAGNQSPPSNELAYTTPPILSLQSPGQGTNAASMSLNFQGSSGKTYTIEATEDFQLWTTVWTTNCTVGGLIAYAIVDPTNYTKRFYRVGQQ